jgi:hypothetical protein
MCKLALLLVQPGCYHIINARRGARIGNVLEKAWKKLKGGLFPWLLEPARAEAASRRELNIEARLGVLMPSAFDARRVS